MELTPNKCWDGKKHDWQSESGSPPYWQGWCKKCGSKSLFRRKYMIAGNFEMVKNAKREPIFSKPKFFESAKH